MQKLIEKELSGPLSIHCIHGDSNIMTESLSEGPGLRPLALGIASHMNLSSEAQGLNNSIQIFKQKNFFVF